MAVASGAIAYTGTYTVDESTKTAHVNIETGTVPNLVGSPISAGSSRPLPTMR